MKLLLALTVVLLALALAGGAAARAQTRASISDQVDVMLQRVADSLPLTPRLVPETASTPTPGPVARALLVARRTYNGKKLPSNRFCARDADNKCNWDLYIKYILTIIVPMIVLAVLSAICCPFLLCLRGCGCVGGKKPRPGICCGSGDEDKLYTHRVVLILKATAVAFFVAIICSFAFAYSGNSDISKGVNEIASSLIDTGQTVVNRISSAGTAMGRIKYTNETIAVSLANAARSAQDIVDQGRDLRKTVNRYEGYRRLFVNLALIIPFVFMFSSIACGLLNFRSFCVHILLAQLVMFFLIIIWMSTAIHSVFALVLSDLCVEARRYVSGDSSDNILNKLLSCENGGSVTEGFQDLVDSAQDGLSEATDGACQRYAVSCAPAASPQLTQCPPVCNSTTLSDFNQAVWVATPDTNNVPVTVANCVSQCVAGSQVQILSLDSVYDADAAVQYTNILENDLIPLVSCDFIRTLLLRLFRGVCTLMSRGLTRTSQSSIAFAVFAMLLIVVGWLGQKRYLKYDDTKDGVGGADGTGKDSYAAQFGATTPPPDAKIEPAAPPPVAAAPIYTTGADSAYSAPPPARGPDAYDNGFYAEPPPPFDAAAADTKGGAKHEEVMLMPVGPMAPAPGPPPLSDDSSSEIHE